MVLAGHQDRLVARQDPTVLLQQQPLGIRVAVIELAQPLAVGFWSARGDGTTLLGFRLGGLPLRIPETHVTFNVND